MPRPQGTCSAGNARGHLESSALERPAHAKYQRCMHHSYILLDPQKLKETSDGQKVQGLLVGATVMNHDEPGTSSGHRFGRPPEKFRVPLANPVTSDQWRWTVVFAAYDGVQTWTTVYV
ncbi:unnamed protein product [Durusdinium trenchii]|uniref:Uncharacterized protein n=1 Tax=Durusdinium trenchii TaxID=1381693 RepID=A0ABP0P9H5_9DINO